MPDGGLTTALLHRYHELVDRQMLESLSALEKEELGAINMQMDEIDESNETLQRAEAQMDARRQRLDHDATQLRKELLAATADYRAT